jgi:pre-mRNA 3'-end-processing factor FIP1
MSGEESLAAPERPVGSEGNEERKESESPSEVAEEQQDDDASKDGEEEEEGEEEEDSIEDDDEDNAMLVLQENVVESAAIDTVKRQRHAAVHTTALGNYAAMVTNGDIFSSASGSKSPWEIVNPCGVHPHDATQSIFSYDLSELPNTPEAKPWTVPGAEMSDWFNYGFNEHTWEKYRKRMLLVIKNKKYESQISVLTEQTGKIRGS